MFDVIIIGGGPAGYKAAFELSKNKKSVVLIDKNKFGGTCLHEGCIPTKSILFSSKHGLSYDLICQKRDNDVIKLYKGLKYRLEKSGAVLINGQAKIIKQEDGCYVVQVGEEIILAKTLIVSTGSTTKELDIPGLKELIANGKAIYSKEFLERNIDFPQNVIIVGGGVIGLEFASFLTNIGKTVTIVEYMPNILFKVIDEDVRQILESSLANKGINVITNAKISEIDETVVYESSGSIDELPFDLVVLAAGRTPNTKNLGLENIGIEIEKNGFIKTNDKCETSCANVYACGDINGKCMLAHVAYKEAEVAVNNILGKESFVNYKNIPSVIFTDPEVAISGYTEDMCKELKIDYFVKKCSMNYSSLYTILNPEQKGICKLIFDKNEVIIGAELVGNGSSEMIFVLSDMIERKETIETIKNKIYPHPSCIEIIKETIGQ